MTGKATTPAPDHPKYTKHMVGTQTKAQEKKLVLLLLLLRLLLLAAPAAGVGLVSGTVVTT